MRIAYVCLEDANDVSTWSGLPFHLLSGIRSQGIQVLVISPLKRRFNPFLLVKQVLARCRHQRIDADRFPSVLDSYARQIETCLRSENVDLILTTSSIPITRLRSAIPIVLYTDAVMHNMIGYNADFSNLTPAAIERGLKQETQALNNVALAVYSSNWGAKGAKEITDPSKVRVVPFGSNLPTTHTDAEIEALIAHRLRRIKKGCTLLFTAVHWQRKGGDVAVNTARLLNEMGIPTKLLIAGCTPPVPLPEFVECFGFISKKTEEGRKQLRSLYERADLFLLPTRAEASAIVFCEASAFGLPILATDTGGVSTYVSEDQNGARVSLADKGGVFANVAQSILRSPESYARLSRGAYRAYSTTLNWQSSVNSLIRLFADVVGDGRPGSAGPSTCAHPEHIAK